MSKSTEINKRVDLKQLKNLVSLHLHQTSKIRSAESLMTDLILKIQKELEDFGDQQLLKLFKKRLMISTNKVQKCLTCLHTVEKLSSSVVINLSDLNTRWQNVTNTNPCRKCNSRQQMHFTHILNNPSLLFICEPSSVEPSLRVDLQPHLFL